MTVIEFGKLTAGSAFVSLIPTDLLAGALGMDWWNNSPYQLIGQWFIGALIAWALYDVMDEADKAEVRKEA